MDATAPAPAWRSPIVLAIAGAWALAAVAQAAGRGGILHHDALVEGGLPAWASVALFVIAWQAMIVAMMLPSSLPLVRLFTATARAQSNPGLVTSAFLGGYAVVWTAFGLLAFFGDVLVHRVVEGSPWLHDRPWLIAGSTLAIAGFFQFSGLKQRCLSECRHPGAYLLKHYRRGAREAFRMGGGHGLFCLGCCWALMLVGFAVGVANLWWMAALTAAMVFEKTGPGGDRAAAPIGVAFLAMAALVLAHPGWSSTLVGSP